MKKFFITLISCIFISISSLFAQGEHLTFRDVPICGTADNMLMALSKKYGYTELTRSAQIILMSGDFAGKTNCEIAVVSTKNSNIVWKIVVLLPKEYSWYDLKSTYIIYKEALMKKYSLNSTYEYFISPYYEGDGYEMSAIRRDKAAFISFFECGDKGNITVEITSNERVVITYEDNMGCNLMEKEKNSAIMPDI